jgi:hypothetical protein
VDIIRTGNWLSAQSYDHIALAETRSIRGRAGFHPTNESPHCGDAWTFAGLRGSIRYRCAELGLSLIQQTLETLLVETNDNLAVHRYDRHPALSRDPDHFVGGLRISRHVLLCIPHTLPRQELLRLVAEGARR